MEAMKEFFGVPDDEMPVQGSRQINDMMVYPCVLMESRDVAACTAVKHSGGV